MSAAAISLLAGPLPGINAGQSGPAAGITPVVNGVTPLFPAAAAARIAQLPVPGGRRMR